MPSTSVQDMETRYPIFKYFAFTHLPERLQKISSPFHQLAHNLIVDLWESKNPAEVSTFLRKLLEAKDCAVRASL